MTTTRATKRATARAAVLTAPGSLELWDVPVPEVGDDDGLLAVEACGICGSDVEQLRAERPADYYPITPGHEPIGTVIALGEGARQRWGVEVGDRVGVEAAISCGRCAHCRSGRSIGCTDPRLPGPIRSYSTIPFRVPPHLWGGYSEVLYLDREARVHQVPDHVTLEEAALLNPMANAIEWSVLTPRPLPGSTAVVLGCGQRGLLCVAALREAGVATIVITGLRSDRHKLELASLLGADVTVCVEDEETIEAVRNATGGTFADLVVDATPYATQPVTDALEITKPGGTIVLAGVKAGRSIPGFVSDRLVMKELTLRGVLAARTEAFDLAMKIIASRRHPLGELHTHAFPLDRAAEAVATLAGHGGGAPAVAITINPDK
ncbi:MAG: zinc-binding dehydrogenase [Acidimicrobiales bacterium]|nr:zinc-binding dehydrogenase [Acidimicrobiales bacterium]